MRDLGRIVGHIPARGGSKRVPAKNLRRLCGKPMIAYAIEAAQRAGVLDDVYVNTDSDDIAALAETLGVQVYRRSARLASDAATGDDFTADFIEQTRPDTLVMISPVCPLVEATDVERAVEAFRGSDCDTLITCQQTQMQTFCNEKAINIDADAPLSPSQDNPVVKILNWAVTVWDGPTFLENYRRNQAGYLGTRRHLLPLDPARCMKISHEEDFQLAELMMRARKLAVADAKGPEYWCPGEPIDKGG